MAAELSVLILIQDGCHFCHDAEALLRRLASEYPLRIDTLDMGTPEGEKMALQSGLLFPPGILLDGRPFCYGRPSEGKLRRAIELLLSEDPPPDWSEATQDGPGLLGRRHRYRQETSPL